MSASKWKTYSDYKSPNSEWFSIIPSHWENLRIKSIVSTKVTDGPHITPVQVDEGVPFLSATSVVNGRLIMEKMWGYISREDHEIYCMKCQPQLDDIFMVKSGATTGSIAFVDFEEEFSVWSPLALIRCDKNKMYPRYTFYSLQSDYMQNAISQTWSKGTQENIAMKAIEELPILIPPLSEQKKIVDFVSPKISKINRTIDNLETMSNLIEEKRSALISKAVTKGLDKDVPMKNSGIFDIGLIPAHWKIISTKYIASDEKYSFVDGPFGSDLKNEEYVQFGIPIIQLNNIKNSKHNLDNKVFITEEKSNQLSKHRAYSGDIVIAKMAEPVARACIVSEKYPLYNIVADCIRLKTKSVNNEFIVSAMNSSYYRLQAEAVSKGTTRIRINLGNLKNLKICIPPLSEQEEIAYFVTEINKDCDTLNKNILTKIEKIKEYRTALISAAVTGKIDVRSF